MKTVDTLDREIVEGKIRHYRAIVSNYQKKYSTSYESYSTTISKADLTSELEDELLDWKEAILMLDVYGRMLGELPNAG